ncbi:MAG: hypothetical protein COV31_03105 [Candidatus Yanofskybacteria bacterium CG10_big_fil_rev_8_21_14_0_10_46_23]|uniref:Uncharacterized protein n=1 Tax=Candidatus Yanofskybacteria bacterium CG10_big_fil_rev_8_21_14_0_10_46_23 TaxID=1975098 RepID=A0A2H0R506_9BACT|nr:MAG: hypothetical protein COV31_03105 [Candidatus Yanofskybacteria bacterium CG10_big_fil_rev_8_21_14_0_10_46_23]
MTETKESIWKNLEENIREPGSDEILVILGRLILKSRVDGNHDALIFQWGLKEKALRKIGQLVFHREVFDHLILEKRRSDDHKQWLEERADQAGFYE